MEVPALTVKQVEIPYKEIFQRDNKTRAIIYQSIFPLKGIHSTFWLPTEVVIRKPQLVTPQSGRVFDTGLFRGLNGEIMTLEEIIAQYEAANLPWNGYGNKVCLLAIEYFYDRGDDGHTDCVLSGYMYVWFDPDKVYTEANNSGKEVDFYEIFEQNLDIISDREHQEWVKSFDESLKKNELEKNRDCGGQ